jgi:SAM-dependent methyltransferase
MVDNISHQQMVPFDTGGSVYSLVHLLQKAVGGPPFRDELIIGAGSGNDIDHALHHGVDRVDAVEIDPVIQNIGVNRNPDRPYADPRVTRHLDDGRHFISTTERKYDLVVYALVDSLILHSSYANIRLESYLFTEEALADIKRILKPGGTFVSYNYFRQAWLVERLAAMTESAFGCKPLVFSLPYRETMRASERTDPGFGSFTIIIAGCNQQIAKAFAAPKDFWLNIQPAKNTNINGFNVVLGCRLYVAGDQGGGAAGPVVWQHLARKFVSVFHRINFNSAGEPLCVED